MMVPVGVCTCRSAGEYYTYYKLPPPPRCVSHSPALNYCTAAYTRPTAYASPLPPQGLGPAFTAWLGPERAPHKYDLCEKLATNQAGNHVIHLHIAFFTNLQSLF